MPWSPPDSGYVYPIDGSTIFSFGFDPIEQYAYVAYANGGYSFVPYPGPPTPQTGFNTEAGAWQFVENSPADMLVPLSSGEATQTTPMGYVPVVLCNGRNCMVARSS